MTIAPDQHRTPGVTTPEGAGSIRVNGTEVSLAGVSAHTTVLDWLRSRGLTGAKEGCAEGECGACSVLVARPGVDSRSGAQPATPTTWTAINACLLPAAALDGQEVVTSEGLGSSSDLHPVQREMAVRGGSQCGFCTPGFVCSMAAEFYRSDRCPQHPDGAEATTPTGDAEHGPNGFDLHALSGNLCRCTGYRPIRDAAFALGRPDADDPLAARQEADPPPAVPTRLRASDGEFARATTLAQAFELLGDGTSTQVVAGSTDWGVEVNLRGTRAARSVAIDRVPELREFEVADESIRIGAALTLTEVEQLLAGRVPLLSELFPQFASRLIRNGATLGGNLGTGSPIGDAPPALLALDARIVLSSARGERELPLADYFTGYRTSVREPDELIRAVVVPLPLAGLTGFHKIAKRRFDDISSVAIGYALDVVDGVVRRAHIGLGGVAATPLRAHATEDALIGRPWNRETVRRAAAVLASEGTPMDDHRASAAYRARMLGASLERFFADGLGDPTHTDDNGDQGVIR